MPTVSANVVEALFEPGVQRLAALVVECGVRRPRSGRRTAGRGRSIRPRCRSFGRSAAAGRMFGTVQICRGCGLFDDAGGPFIGLAFIDSDRIEVVHVVVLNVINFMLKRRLLDLGRQGGVDIN